MTATAALRSAPMRLRGNDKMAVFDQKQIYWGTL
jgi:hypothetical protein